MLKQVNRIINTIMGSFTGVFIGNGLYTYWDYCRHPAIYATWSAPWYTSIQVTGVALAVVLCICITVKICIRKKMGGT